MLKKTFHQWPFLFFTFSIKTYFPAKVSPNQAVSVLWKNHNWPEIKRWRVFTGCYWFSLIFSCLHPVYPEILPEIFSLSALFLLLHCFSPCLLFLCHLQTNRTYGMSENKSGQLHSDTKPSTEFSISTKPAEEHSARMSERWQREEKDYALAKNHTSFNVLKLPEGCLVYNKEANIAPRDQLRKLCYYDICAASFTSC